MSNVSITLSPQHKANLSQLANYLLAGGVMVKFNDRFSESFMNEQVNCGSVACAISHAPYAGITKQYNESWDSFAYRVFGLKGVAWAFCFDEEWVFYDNTPQGVAKRILFMLQCGIPLEFLMFQSNQESYSLTIEKINDYAKIHFRTMDSPKDRL